MVRRKIISSENRQRRLHIFSLISVRFPYLRYFGGVGSFSKEQFEKINGYSNMFWGWGGEDDDAYNRYYARTTTVPKRKTDQPCSLATDYFF